MGGSDLDRLRASPPSWVSELFFTRPCRPMYSTVRIRPKPGFASRQWPPNRIQTYWYTSRSTALEAPSFPSYSCFRLLYAAVQRLEPMAVDVCGVRPKAHGRSAGRSEERNRSMRSNGISTKNRD